MDCWTGETIVESIDLIIVLVLDLMIEMLVIVEMLIAVMGETLVEAIPWMMLVLV